MLKELRISNIILIESAEIFFHEGLNVLTGETGAGKSAVMQALSLAAGSRTDSSILRKGAQKGFVEAVFEPDDSTLKNIKNILNDAGVDHEDSENLIIRREISSSGKNRAFINNQTAQLHLLKNIGSRLIGIVGQHASRHLTSVEKHRTALDLYGSHEDDMRLFASTWELETRTRKKLEALIHNEAQRLREIEVCLMEIAELKEASLKEGEDEELFEEYTLLVNAEESAIKVQQLCQALSGEKNSVLTILNRHKDLFDEIATINPRLKEAADSFKNALADLQEVDYSLSAFQSRLESNPSRTAEVDERLALINRLKKKYGPTLQEAIAYQKNAEERLETLKDADNSIDALKAELRALEAKSHALAQKLTAKRKHTAASLERAVVEQLCSLNMPKVDFVIEISPQKRSSTGDDLVEFFLVPNVGEHRIPVKDCASGGELSRLMLAIQTILAGKEQVPTLVFDEIDANIGGATAATVGEKLKEIGGKHQVLCITHFPQVAKHALHHLRISKHEQRGRTITKVQTLAGEECQAEIDRMLGVMPKPIENLVRYTPAETLISN